MGDATPATFAVRATPVVAWVLSALFAGAALMYVGTIWLAPAASYPISTAPFMPVMLSNLHVAGIDPESVIGGGLSSGTVLIEDADPEIRIYATLAALASTALFVAVALTVAGLARALRTGVGITDRLARSFGLLAAVVLVLGLVWQWWQQAAAYAAGVMVFGVSDYSGDWPEVGEPSDEITFRWPYAEFSLTIDLWPVWAALALGALAAALTHAARMQRDTAGLV